MQLMLKRLGGVVLIVLLLSSLNSCLVFKIRQDSPPLVDCGTPLVGHFRNGDTPKAILYTSLFVTSILAVFLFAPLKDNKSIIPIEREVSDPLFYSFIGASTGSLIGSSIDTSVTYHLANKKIIELNNIYWLPFVQTEISKELYFGDLLKYIMKAENRTFVNSLYSYSEERESYLLKRDLSQEEERRLRQIMLLSGFQSNTKLEAIRDFR